MKLVRRTSQKVLSNLINSSGGSGKGTMQAQGFHDTLDILIQYHYLKII